MRGYLNSLLALLNDLAGEDSLELDSAQISRLAGTDRGAAHQIGPSRGIRRRAKLPQALNGVVG
jgi:hypothetical protein